MLGADVEATYLMEWGRHCLSVSEQVLKGETDYGKAC